MNTEGTGILFAIGLVMLFFAGLLYLYREENFLLKNLFILGILVAGLFIPTGVVQLRTTCDILVKNATVTANTTSYAYAQQCFTTATTAPDTFYIVFWSIYQIIMLYFILKIIYHIAKPVWEKMKR